MFLLSKLKAEILFCFMGYWFILVGTFPGDAVDFYLMSCLPGKAQSMFLTALRSSGAPRKFSSPFGTSLWRNLVVPGLLFSCRADGGRQEQNDSGHIFQWELSLSIFKPSFLIGDFFLNNIRSKAQNQNLLCIRNMYYKITPNFGHHGGFSLWENVDGLLAV